MNTNDTKVKGELNLILRLYIYLVIANHIAGLVITTPVMFAQVSDYNVSESYLWWSVFLHLAMIYAMFDVLKVRRRGLYILGGLQIVNTIAQCVDFGRDFWEMLFVSVGVCSIFALLLCLRKNGKSAWRLFFSKDSTYNQSNNKLETFIDTEEKCKEQSSIDTGVVANRKEVANHTTPNKARRKRTIAVVGCVVLLSSLVALLITTCGSRKIELEHNAIGEVANPLQEVYSYLKDEDFANLGSFSEFELSLVHDYNVERIASKLIRDEYEGLKSKAEVESYLGVANLYHTLYVGNEEFTTPLSTFPSLRENNFSFNAKYLCNGKVYRVAICDIEQFLQEYPSARLHVTIKLNNVDYQHKRRLLYYSLLGTKYLSKKELGSVGDFLKSLGSEEKIRKFYWQLMDYGFTASEIGSEELFCNLLLADLNTTKH